MTSILDPQGPVGLAEKTILLDSLAIMLAIVGPTLICIFAFAFWFRASNAKARYQPQWSYSGRIELVVWSVPTLTVILLGGVAWIGSHALDPAKPIEGAERSLRIQVVSLDWKWLFVYPDLRVAAVNELVVPTGAALRFELTSASVMNAFFIPQFGSMIYTMNGMVTRLNLKADNAGTYRGMSSHFSGAGFPGMTFDVRAVSAADFDAWTRGDNSASATLDRDAYMILSKPSFKNAPTRYRIDDVTLFDDIVSQKIPPASGPSGRPGDAAQKPDAHPLHLGAAIVR